MAPPPRAVILDFGGVLGLPQDSRRTAAMREICRLSAEEFPAVYNRHRLELDRGALAADEYWRGILSAGGVEPTAELVERLEREDTMGWTQVNRAVVQWSAELRAAGIRTAILSNMPHGKLSFMRGRAEFRWIEDFAVAVFSCEVGMVKPEPGIYRLCLERLGSAPGECVFLDDGPANVEGARAVGIPSMVFRSAGEAAAEIERRWRLPVRGLKEGRHG
jgi:putative hydrolase of the HAD superfamily